VTGPVERAPFLRAASAWAGVRAAGIGGLHARLTYLYQIVKLVSSIRHRVNIQFLHEAYPHTVVNNYPFKF